MHETSTVNVEATLNAHFRTALGLISVPSYFAAAPSVVQNWPEIEASVPCFSFHHLAVSKVDQWEGRGSGVEGIKAVRSHAMMEISAWVSRDKRINGQDVWQAQLRFMQGMIEQVYLQSSVIVIKDYSTPASPTVSNYIVRTGDLNPIQTAEDPNPAIQRRKFQFTYSWELRADSLPVRITFSDYNVMPPQFAPAPTWSISGSKAINTPTEGSEGSTDGGMENWLSTTNLTSWTEQTAGTSTVNQESSSVHGGTYAVRYDIDGSGSQGRIFQSTNLAANIFHKLVWWSRGSDTVPKSSITGTALGLNNNPSRSLTASYQQFIANGLTTSANGQLILDSTSNASKSIYYDDVSIKPLTLASLFAVINCGRNDVIVKAYANAVTGTFIGAVCALDNRINPQNFVVAWCTDTYARMVKFVAGTPTDVVAVTAITYVAGAALEIRKSGTTFSLYYNSTLVGSGTVSDTAIISNTWHGLFSCYAGNQFDSLTIVAN